MGNVEERVSILRGDLVEALKFLNGLVVSLDRIGSATAHLSSAERALVLDRYVDEWNVFRRASLVRRALSEYFSDDLGPDDVDELERNSMVPPTIGRRTQPRPTPMIPGGGTGFANSAEVPIQVGTRCPSGEPPEDVQSVRSVRREEVGDRPWGASGPGEERHGPFGNAPLPDVEVLTGFRFFDVLLLQHQGEWVFRAVGHLGEGERLVVRDKGPVPVRPAVIGVNPHPVFEHGVPDVPTAGMGGSWIRTDQGLVQGGRKTRLCIHPSIFAHKHESDRAPVPLPGAVIWSPGIMASCCFGADESRRNPLNLCSVGRHRRSWRCGSPGH